MTRAGGKGFPNRRFSDSIERCRSRRLTLSMICRAATLKELVLELLGEVAALKQIVAEQRDEIARLKGGTGRPNIKPNKPSGMEQASEQKAPSSGGGKRRGRGKKKLSRVAVEDRVVEAAVPAGSPLQGLRGLRRPGSGHPAGGDPLPARALGDARWPNRRGAAAGRHRRTFRAGAAPLRAGAVPSGSGHRGAAGHAARCDRHRDLQAPGDAAADRRARTALSRKRARCCAPAWKRRPG